MGSLQDLSRRVARLEEEQRRQREMRSPERRRRRLEDAAARGCATLDQYAELLADEIEDTRANALASTPLWVSCKGAGFNADNGLGAALAYPPDAALPTATSVEHLRYIAESDLSLPRRGSLSHPHWDHLYTPERRAEAALWVLAFGRDDDALELRRAAWTRSESHRGWELSEGVRTSARETGLSLSQIKEAFGPGRVVHTGSDWSPEKDLTGEHQEEAVEGEEPWVAYATLAAVVDQAVSRLK